jgi:hypothetical protein
VNIHMWYNPIVQRFSRKPAKKPKSKSKGKGDKRMFKRSLLLILMVVLTVATLLAITWRTERGTLSFQDVVPTDTLVVFPTLTNTFTKTETPTPTNTNTPNNTPTHKPTGTPTVTLTASPEPTVDPDPLVLLVNPDDAPTSLEKVLTQATERGYEIVPFKNMSSVGRPLVVVFDNVPLAGASGNQLELLQVMERFGRGVLAVNVAGRSGSGTPYLYSLVEEESWEYALQSEGYVDLSTAPLSSLIHHIGICQIKAGGEAYDGKNYFPNVWVPPFGVFGSNFQALINDVNTAMTTQARLQKLNSKGITIVVTNGIRSSYESISGPVELYPYTLLDNIVSD